MLIAVRARRQNWPVTGPAASGHLARAARRAAVPLGLPVLLFGGIFSGATTVTEAALLAVVYALVAGVLIGGIKREALPAQLAQSGIVTATTLWVLAAASAFAWILVREWVPQTLGEWMGGIGAGRWGFLGLTIVLFVVIGALLEGLPALLIFGPILFPISRTIGIDPVHYGIVIVAAMGIAFFLPPVGVGLSIAAGIARVDIDDVTPELCAVSGRAADRAGADRGVPERHADPAAAVSRVTDRLAVRSPQSAVRGFAGSLQRGAWTCDGGDSRRSRSQEVRRIRRKKYGLVLLSSCQRSKLLFAAESTT